MRGGGIRFFLKKKTFLVSLAAGLLTVSAGVIEQAHTLFPLFDFKGKIEMKPRL